MKWLARCCWLYAGAVIAFWALLSLGGERWGSATVLLYAPRWPAALPLLVLAPLAVARRRRLVPVLAVAAAVVIGPVLGLCLPLGAAGESPGTARLRVLTCNTQGSHLNAAAFGELLAETAPDVVALQEWDAAKAAEAFRYLDGWHTRSDSYGLALASRFPVESVETLRDADLGGAGVVGRYRLTTPAGPLEVVNVHLATPRGGLEAVIRSPRGGWAVLERDTQERWRVSERASAWAGRAEGLVIAGDFNLPADSAIFRRHWSDLADCYAAAGLGFGATKHTRWHGVRIDHVLAGVGWSCRRCRVGRDVGSDHKPVVADLVRETVGG